MSRRTLAVDLPLVLLAVLVLWTLLHAGAVPSPAAAHFDAAGVPDGQLPRALALALAPALAAAGAAMIGLATSGGRRVANPASLAALAYGLIGLAAGLQLVLLASNRDAATAGQAHLAGQGWLALVVPALALGAWCGRRVRTQPVALASRGARVTVRRQREDVVVALHGLDVVWSLRRRLRFPRSALLGAAVAPREAVARRGLRLPGTEVPGVIRAGSYGRGERRAFWDVRDGPRLLVLTLASGHGYARVVLEPADPDLVLAGLQA